MFNDALKMFTEFYKENGGTYSEHIKKYWLMGFKSIGVGLLFITHGLVPVLFKGKGDELLKKIKED